jgi:hypothetical protein
MDTIAPSGCKTWVDICFEHLCLQLRALGLVAGGNIVDLLSCINASRKWATASAVLFPAFSSVSKRVLNHAWPSIQNSSQKLNLNRMRIGEDDFSSRILTRFTDGGRQVLSGPR